MKRCPDCGETKAAELFPRNKRAKDGLGFYCKACHNARGRESVARNGGARVYHLRRRYGVDEAAFAALVAAQGGLCAICRVNAASHLDHCHDSGVVRGLLCVPCNNGLGLFRDDPNRLEAAACYLRLAAQRSAEGGGQ